MNRAPLRDRTTHLQPEIHPPPGPLPGREGGKSVPYHALMTHSAQSCTIHTIDTNWIGLPRYTAVYLLEGPDGLAIVETGPYCANENVLAGIRERGFDPADVKHVLVSHIHLDHAGAAWWWAKQGAQVYVHEFGARHLIDPSALLNSAGRIYGDRMDYLWGAVEPIDDSRVTPVHDGDVVEVAGLTLTAIESPGHARHHHAYALTTEDLGSICFTGDAAAMVMPEGDFIAVPTPPPEFDLDLWLATLDRLEAMNFDAIFPTHFDIVRDGNRLLSRLAVALKAHVDFVEERMDRDMTRERIFEEMVEWQRAIATELGTSNDLFERYSLDHLIPMNVTGLMRYLKKKREAANA